MSRTYRKPQWYVENNDVSHENHYLRGFNGTKRERRLKPVEQYKAECEAADRRYDDICRKEGKYVTRWHWLERRYVEITRPRFYVSKFIYTTVPYSIEEARIDAKAQRDSYTRDGALKDGTRRKQYKNLSKKAVRNEWKKMKNKIMKDENYDAHYPHDQLGKKYIWAVW